MSALVPILLKPKLLTMRNFWRRREEMRQFWIRNFILLLMTVTIMYGAYRGSLWVLGQTETQLDYAYFPPGVILGLFLALLLVVLVLTNSASAAGALFLGQDLEVIIASPLSPFRFFCGKLCEIFVSSSWMTAVFLLPILCAFASHYHAPPTYFAMCALTLVPFFLIPASLAIFGSSLVALLVPANWRKGLLTVLAVLLLVGLYSLARMVTQGVDDGKPIDTRDLFRLISLLSVANTTWSPAFWSSSILGETLVHSGIPMWWYMSLLYAVAAALLSLDFLLIRFFYFRSYSRAVLHAQSGRIVNRFTQAQLERWFFFLSPPVRALAVKEVKTSARDAVQAIQIIFICIICALYLYVLSFQGLFQRMVPDESKNWWRVFLISCNFCIEAFVVTAIANRLVYPSISREGRAFWGLQTAPLSMKKLLSIKFVVWLVFVAVFTSLVFGGATLLLTHSVGAVLCKILLNFATSVSVIGLAIGLGAYFANFDWEHPAQLIMGFGNMVYMVIAVGLIGGNLLSGAGLLLMMFMGRDGGGAHHLAVFALVFGGCVAALLGNALIAAWALRFGARALEKKK